MCIETKKDLEEYLNNMVSIFAIEDNCIDDDSEYIYLNFCVEPISNTGASIVLSIDNTKSLSNAYELFQDRFWDDLVESYQYHLDDILACSKDYDLELNTPYELAYEFSRSTIDGWSVRVKRAVWEVVRENFKSVDEKGR